MLENHHRWKCENFRHSQSGEYGEIAETKAFSPKTVKAVVSLKAFYMCFKIQSHVLHLGRASHVKSVPHIPSP